MTRALRMTVALGAFLLAACATIDGGEEMGLRFEPLNVGEFTYDVRRAGAGDELVILLHGFPETSHMWIPLIEHLAANGYTAVAPDLRG